MKNEMNEGQAVLVGRDGQEIEGECGRRLAGEIDEVGGVGERREIDNDGWGARVPPQHYDGRGGEGGW